MIIIKLIRETYGADIVKKMEDTYGSVAKLERIVERNPKDAKAYYDLDDWKYFANHLDEKIEETDMLIKNNFTFSKIEMDLLDLIKNDNPHSLRELANLANKDVSNILPKINNLEKEGLISLKEGHKNSKIPVLNYDKIEIAI